MEKPGSMINIWETCELVFIVAMKYLNTIKVMAIVKAQEIKFKKSTYSTVRIKFDVKISSSFQYQQLFSYHTFSLDKLYFQ